MNHQDAYTGVENLESMREAKRYNRFLVDLVLANRRGSGPVLDFGAAPVLSRCYCVSGILKYAAWNLIDTCRQYWDPTACR